MWYTVRQKAISLRDLDGLFSVIEDPSWFILGVGMMKKAKVASFMALCTWLVYLCQSLFSLDYERILIF